MRTVFSGFRGRERATGNNIDLVDLESPSAAPVQILSAKDVRPTRYLAAIFAAFGGILISLSAFFAVSSWEHRLADVKLRELAKNYQQTLNSDLEKATDLLYTLRANFATTNNTLSRGEFQAFARARHASDLMIPSEVWVLDKLPLLGSGKVDMVAVAKLVSERTAARPEAELRTRAIG